MGDFNRWRGRARRGGFGAAATEYPYYQRADRNEEIRTELWARHRVLQAGYGKPKVSRRISLHQQLVKEYRCATAQSVAVSVALAAAFLHEQVLDLYRQFPHAHSCGVVNCIGDGGGDARQPDLADAAGTDFVELLIGIVKEVDLALRRVCVHRNEIIRQAAVDRSPIL